MANGVGAKPGDASSLTTQSMLQMLTSISAMPGASGATNGGPGSSSNGGAGAHGASGALPGLSALNLPGQAAQGTQEQERTHEQAQGQGQGSLTDALLGRGQSTSAYGTSGDADASVGTGSYDTGMLHANGDADDGSGGRRGGECGISASSLSGFWDVVGCIRRGVPPDSELRCVLPSTSGGIGVAYRSEAGQWGSCLMQGTRLVGHQHAASLEDAVEHINAAMSAMQQPMQVWGHWG